MGPHRDSTRPDRRVRDGQAREGRSSVGRNTFSVAPGLSIEDHGDEFYLVWEGVGHDVTFALDGEVAVRLAEFILSRRGEAALGGRESLP